MFTSRYSNKNVLHGSNQSHISNIAARYEVPPTWGNTFFQNSRMKLANRWDLW